MDIQKWLNETADASAPPDPAQTAGSTFFQRPEKAKPVFKEKHAPKRSKSDSSLLDPQPPTHKAPPKRPKAPAEKSPDPSARSEASSPSHSESAGSESSSHRYARKPRRKTRVERYEPKVVDERGKHAHRSRKDKSKKSRRKPTRQKGEQSGSGQGFHANNVSKDRLTLKPRDQLGIFNKGKTSSAVRGRGLPDLVFSEMKFLQKEKPQPEAAAHQDIPKKKRKKDHTHTREGEISAFFTAVRPALAEKDGNTAPREDGNAAVVDTRQEREQSTKSSGVVPTVEVLDKGPYLGFGSRGPRHESTSYVSWSDSVRERDVTPRHREQVLPVAEEHSGAFQHQAASTTTDVEKTVFKRPAPRAAKHGRNDSIENFKVSSVDPSESRQRASRSHSYPQQSSSSQKVNLVDRAAKFHSTDPVDSPSSMPPSMPAGVSHDTYRIGPTAGRRPAGTEQFTPSHMNRTSTRPHTTKDDTCEPTDVEPRLSSDLGAVIEQCNTTFRERRPVNGPQRRHTVLPEQAYGPDRMERSAVPGAITARHVRFSGLEQPSPIAPNFSGPSIYERQAQRQAGPLPNLYHEDVALADSRLAGQEYLYDGYDMMYGESNLEAYPEETASYEFDEGAPGYEVEDAQVLGDRVQRLGSDNSVVAPGFWRPNRLY